MPSDSVVWRELAKRAQAENEKLQAKIERQAFELTSLCEALRLRNDELRAYKAQTSRFLLEGVKLRQLVADMWFWHYEGHIDSESKDVQMRHIDNVLDRMRDLEVLSYMHKPREEADDE